VVNIIRLDEQSWIDVGGFEGYVCGGESWQGKWQLREEFPSASLILLFKVNPILREVHLSFREANSCF
jgi:hypothetical protein